MTEQFQKLKKFIILYVVTYLICCVSMCIVYALPQDRIRQHVAQSKEIFEEEGSYPRLISWRISSQLDNFTDALMLLMAGYEGEGPFYQDAFRNTFPAIEGNTPTQTLIRIYTDEDTEYIVNNYNRYWHGYLLYLKPLLCFFSYRGIRLLWGILQVSLTSIVLILFIRRRMVTEIVPFLAVYLFLDPAAMSLSLQHGIIFLLVVIQFLVILLFEETYAAREDIWLYHFFITGCLTSFFDFLTYPLVTFGITGAFIIYKYAKAGKDGFISFIKIFFTWGCGYVLFWAGKWVGGSIILKSNIIRDAASAMRFRSGYQTVDQSFSYLGVLFRNLGARWIFLGILSLAFFICVWIGKTKRTDVQNKARLLILFALLPFVWYLVVANHSYEHFWFTFRELAVTVYVLVLYGTACLGNSSVRKINLSPMIERKNK